MFESSLSLNLHRAIKNHLSERVKIDRPEEIKNKQARVECIFKDSSPMIQ